MMNRIDAKFNELRKARKKAFIAFITAGDPDLQVTEDLALAFETAGVDILEIGVPFSDPMADGPIIQAASFRALQKGVTLKKILSTVKKIRESSQIPIALMSYYNPIFHFGIEKFILAAKEAGVDGLVIPDLPVEEAADLSRYAKGAGIATIFFLAPTTARERMPAIVKAATGFIYFVSVAGVTGAKKAVPSDIMRQIRLARTMTKKPICVGFGVSTSEQVKAMGRISDGVIVGSAIVKEIEKNVGQKDMIGRVARFVRHLAAVL
ncbi:MAG: tryptophan synthase subunit alpha [Candidatus Omnitrophica bacterium]|nr:tryptophan synthase subunit alpha [Candidatus Omnitrophota bacterium]